jgi:ADP-ribose pyrophosphatase YjhB (NUDIX family)
VVDYQTPKHIVAACGLVRNAARDVLLVRHPQRGWEIPGGQVEEGETLPDALIREIQEESGVTASVRALGSVTSNLTLPTKVIFGFLCEYISGKLTTSDESLETAWVNADVVLKRITHPVIYDRTRDLLAFDRHVIYRAYTIEPYTVVDERRV